jgi:hypothetical protein
VSLTLPTSPLLFLACFAINFGLGGKGIGREGMLVREGTRVGWIEETQRKTMVCVI